VDITLIRLCSRPSKSLSFRHLSTNDKPWPETRNADRLRGLVIGFLGFRARGLVFDSQRQQILLELVGLERGPLSLVRKNEELLERKSRGSGLENQD
jgi:hypothetical protein